MKIRNSKIKFFSVVSGNDNRYQSIKDNFLKHLEILYLAEKHDLIITNTDSGNWEESGFLDTVYQKLDMTLYYLKKGYYVFCSDLDIVFLKDPFPYLIDLMNIYNYDILFQHDYADEGESGIYSVYCTGFFLVKPSSLTKKLFDRNINIFNKSNKIELPMGDRSDQKYINRKLTQKRFKELSIGLLKRAHFPNGWYWRNYFKQINPYIVHYNCIDGGIEAKENEMRKFNHWLL